jgi:hypothetical protein
MLTESTRAAAPMMAAFGSGRFLYPACTCNGKMMRRCIISRSKNDTFFLCTFLPALAELVLLYCHACLAQRRYSAACGAISMLNIF